MHNVLSRRELIVLGYLSKSPRSFKHINVYTTSQKVILKCTFHSETKTEKWLLIFFPFVEQDTDYLLPSSWKQPPMTTAVIGLGLLASLMQFKFMGLSPMRPSPFSFSTVRPDWEKSNREIILWCSDTNSHEIQLFLSCRSYILKKSCLWQKSVLDTKQ